MQKRIGLGGAVMISMLTAMLMLSSAYIVIGPMQSTENDTILSASTVWDGSVATSFAAGDGTAGTPYEISNGAELAYLREVVNAGANDTDGVRFNDPSKYFVLTNDISLNSTTNWMNWDASAPANEWTPIDTAYDSLGFIANFDGDGHAVKGIYINKPGSNGNRLGLFGVLSGRISNLSVEESYIRGESYIGSIAGKTWSGSEITNCHNSGTVVGVGRTNDSGNHVIGTGSRIGGIAGEVWTDCVVTDCSNAGNIIGVSNVGGIAGWMGNYPTPEYSTLTGCYNTGGITGIASVGGIIGYVAQTYIMNSYNTGAVTGINGFGGDSLNIGGIVGQMAVSDVLNCYNTGAVIGSDYVGGIAGHVSTATGSNNTIENCYNIGTIARTGTSGHYGGTYGIGGGFESNTVVNCYWLAGSAPSGGAGYDAGKTRIASFNSNGEFASPYANVYNGAATLLDALNTWVGDNDSDESYLYWKTFIFPEFAGENIAERTVIFSAIGNGTIIANTGGLAKLSGETVMEGRSVTFTASPDTNYRIKEWKVNDAVISEKSNFLSMTMPTFDISVTVEFEPIPSTPRNDDGGGGGMDMGTVAIIVGAIAAIGVVGVVIFKFFIARP
jgi:hypothetical protein